MDPRDAVMLVSGGASGLGRACVERFVRQGAKVALLDLPGSEGDAVAAALGPAVSFVPADVTDETHAERAVMQTVAHFGALHGLVNCAGIAPAALTVGRDGPQPLSAYRRAVDINLVGTFNLVRLAADAMSRQPANGNGERGVIVNTASVTAFDGQVGQAAYAASKAGVAGMTLPLARELARFGIRVMTVAPGVFETPMWHAAPQKVREALAGDVPFPARPGRAPEFAALVQAILENPYLNGEVIRLDGAARLPFRR